MEYTYLIYFSLFWIAVLYIFNCLLARKVIKPDFKLMFLYSSTVLLLGMFGEVLIDTIYNFLFDKPLWEYHLLPIHNGYTSYYSLFVWSCYGFHLYLMHENAKVQSRLSNLFFAVIIGIEAIILEVLVNLAHIALTGSYIFYYLPGDLWHLTSIQAIPVYIFAGYLIAETIKRMKVSRRFFIILNVTLVFIFVFLV